MKITAIIADDNRPEGWPECFTLQSYMPPPYGDGSAAHTIAATQVQNIVARFNGALRPSGLPRRLRSIQLEEIEDADAWNMGLSAYHDGKVKSENYWPANHANHAEWLNGWETAEAESEED